MADTNLIFTTYNRSHSNWQFKTCVQLRSLLLQYPQAICFDDQNCQKAIVLFLRTSAGAQKSCQNEVSILPVFVSLLIQRPKFENMRTTRLIAGYVSSFSAFLLRTCRNNMLLFANRFNKC